MTRNTSGLRTPRLSIDVVLVWRLDRWGWRTCWQRFKIYPFAAHARPDSHHLEAEFPAFVDWPHLSAYT